MSQWVITEDLNDDPCDDTSQVGARSVDCPIDWQLIANDPDGIKFRMRDESGRVVYRGVYVGDMRDEEIMREPLVLIGERVAQCVQIAYETQAGRWEVI